MFDLFPLTITFLFRQLCWCLNTRTLVLSLVHARVEPEVGGGTCMPHSGSPSLHGPEVHPTFYRRTLVETGLVLLIEVGYNDQS